MFKSKIRKYHLAIVSAVTLAFAIGSPARAENVDSLVTLSALTDHTSRSKTAATAVLSNLGETASLGGDNVNLIARNMGIAILLPTRSSGSLRVELGNGDTIGIALPFAGNDSPAESLGAGLVAYNNRNSSVTVPLAKDDGSLQITTVLKSQDAPEAFPYHFALPRGSKIIAKADGLAIMDGNRFIAGLSAPWAKDAKGRDVPTRYEVFGKTVTQIVNHKESNFAYPIVADPWLGLNIFSTIAIGAETPGDQPVVNLNLSPWGWSIYLGLSQGGGVMGLAAGQAILTSAGWDEAWSKGGVIQAALNKPSQHQQFDCHALGALAAGDWNLEKFRLNRRNGNWQWRALEHHCNWKTADAY